MKTYQSLSSERFFSSCRNPGRLIFHFAPVLVFCFVISPGLAADHLKQAWETLPPHFQNGVVKVSADNATATSHTWYFIAKNTTSPKELFSISVTDGQITQEKRSLDLREFLTHPTIIDFQRIEAGSSAAWTAASNFAASNGRTLGTVSYVLTQDGQASAPIWNIWCYSPDGSYFGLLKMLATDGTIISSQAD